MKCSIYFSRKPRQDNNVATDSHVLETWKRRDKGNGEKDES